MIHNRTISKVRNFIVTLVLTLETLYRLMETLSINEVEGFHRRNNFLQNYKNIPLENLVKIIQFYLIS